MSLACLDSSRTAHVRSQYGGTARLTFGEFKRCGRVIRKWSAADNEFLATHGPTSTTRQLAKALGRGRSAVGSQLHKLGIRPVLERSWQRKAHIESVVSAVPLA